MSEWEYDEHEPCKREIAHWQAQVGKGCVIKEVIQEIEGGFKVLHVVRVDPFRDGMRVVVR